jgi:8-oxo-dGTP pyrophosphatase MutT (NUDIX family)
MADTDVYETGELIPWRNESGLIKAYLQKRDMQMDHYPGYIAVFGGAIEPGETPEEGMLREIKEELDVAPSEYRLLGVYASPGYLRHVFIGEGEYGKFFNPDQINAEPLISPETRAILKELFSALQA